MKQITAICVFLVSIPVANAERQIAQSQDAMQWSSELEADLESATKVREKKRDPEAGSWSYCLGADFGFAGHGYFAAVAFGGSIGYGFHLSMMFKKKTTARTRGLRLTFHYTEQLRGKHTGCGLGCIVEEVFGGQIIGGSIGYLWQWSNLWYSLGGALNAHREEVRVVLGDDKGKESTNFAPVPALSMALGYRLPLTESLELQASLELDTLIVSWHGRAYVGAVVDF